MTEHARIARVSITRLWEVSCSVCGVVGEAETQIEAKAFAAEHVRAHRDGTV